MIAVFLVGAAIVLLAHALWYGRNWMRNLSVLVLFSQPHVYAGETLELTEIIENRKRMALPVTEIGFRLPRGLHFEDAQNTQESDYIYKRDLFAVSGMERILRRYHITAQQRGHYSVSQLTCHTPSRLFQQTWRMDIEAPPEDSGLYVYPANIDCGVLLQNVEVLLGEQECAKRLYEDPFVFSSIRPYTIQDPMKTVNWKATAKAGHLMVNTYASTAAVHASIYLDLSLDPGNPDADELRELGIAAAASLIRRLIRSRRDAALVTNYAPDGSCVRFESCMGAEKLTAVETFLTTDFDPSYICPFPDLLQQKPHARRMSGSGTGSQMEVSVFLTSKDSPALRTAVHSMLGPSGSGVLALLSLTSNQRQDEQEQNLRILTLQR